ncbi:MAG: hypothetical protein R3C16_09940 [Hyphomonadaceae bacterium]
MLFEAYDEVSVLPGATNARETLARTGLDYLEALAADPDAPQDVRLEAGLGFLRLSRVVGGGDVAELGRYADAKALIERAESIIAPLYAANSDDPQVRRAMGQLLVDQTADLLYADNDAAGARAKAIQAQEVMRPLSRADVEAARMYAVAMQGEADSYGWDDNYEAALPRHIAADDFIANLPPALRDDVQLMRARAANSRLMGEAHHRLGHVEEARAAIDRAVDLNRAVRDTDPNNPAYTRNLAISTWYRAVVHRTNGRDELARQSIEESVSMARILRERDPNDAGALRMLAISNEVYAQILADQGRYAESYATGSEVIAIHHDLVQRADGAAGARRSLGAALMTHGGNSYNAGTYVRACAAWTEARDTFRALAAADQLSAFDRSNLLAVSEDYVARACNPPGPGLDDHS